MNRSDPSYQHLRPSPRQCGIEPEQYFIRRNVLPGRSRFITRQQTTLDEGTPRLALFDIQLGGFQRKTGQIFVFLHDGSAQPPHQQQPAAEGLGGADAHHLSQSRQRQQSKSKCFAMAETIDQALP